MSLFGAKKPLHIVGDVEVHVETPQKDDIQLVVYQDPDRPKHEGQWVWQVQVWKPVRLVYYGDGPPPGNWEVPVFDEFRISGSTQSEESAINWGKAAAEKFKVRMKEKKNAARLREQTFQTFRI